MARWFSLNGNGEMTGDDMVEEAGFLEGPVFMPHHLKRLARTGATSGDGSGDIFIALSTANAGAAADQDVAQVSMLSNARISALFRATVEATEEAIVNALVAAQTMVGVSGHRGESLSHEKLRQLMKR
jgi:L-aminopeptidase/D-esterase-like protein